MLASTLRNLVLAFIVVFLLTLFAEPTNAQSEPEAYEMGRIVRLSETDSTIRYFDGVAGDPTGGVWTIGEDINIVQMPSGAACDAVVTRWDVAEDLLAEDVVAGAESNFGDQANLIEVAPDGSMIVVGTICDHFGTILQWEMSGWSMEEICDQRNLWIAKYDETLTASWIFQSHVALRSIFKPKAMTLGDDGTICVTGTEKRALVDSFSLGYTRSICVDAAGALLWDTTDVDSTCGYDLKLDKEGNLWVGAGLGDIGFEGYDGHGSLLKYDNSGNLLFADRELRISRLAYDGDDGVYFLAVGWGHGIELVKVNLSGVQQWSLPTNSAWGSDFLPVGDLIVKENGTIIASTPITYYIPNTDYYEKYMYLLSADASGGILWDWVLTAPEPFDEYESVDIMNMSDGKILFAGRIYNTKGYSFGYRAYWGLINSQTGDIEYEFDHSSVFGGPSQSEIQAIVLQGVSVDGHGNVYLAGYEFISADLEDPLLIQFHPQCVGCWINGICEPDGAKPNDNGNPCLVCDSARDDLTWSYDDGSTCDDGVWCNGDVDVCLQGECLGDAPPCDPDQACDEIGRDCNDTSDDENPPEADDEHESPTDENSNDENAEDTDDSGCCG